MTQDKCKSAGKEWTAIVFALLTGAALILLPVGQAATISPHQPSLPSVRGFLGPEECDDIPAAACFMACGYACRAPGVYCGFTASCVVNQNKAVCDCTCKLCMTDLL